MDKEIYDRLGSIDERLGRLDERHKTIERDIGEIKDENAARNGIIDEIRMNLASRGLYKSGGVAGWVALIGILLRESIWWLKKG